MDFATRLLEFRARYRLTQVEAAKVLGVTEAMIVRYEKKQSKPTNRNLVIFLEKMKKYEEL